MCRPASPDSGDPGYGIPLEHRMWQHAQQQRVGHLLGDLTVMHADDCQHRSVYITCSRVPSTHVQVAPHGHHAVI
jgi:hypothetical protein